MCKQSALGLVSAPLRVWVAWSVHWAQCPLGVGERIKGLKVRALGLMFSPTVSSCVTLDWLPNFSEPQFARL